MDLDRFEQMAELARGDLPPQMDAASPVLARLRSAGGPDSWPGATAGCRGIVVALVSVSSIAACVLGILGLRAVAVLDQAGTYLLDPLNLWVNL